MPPEEGSGHKIPRVNGAKDGKYSAAIREKRNEENGVKESNDGTEKGIAFAERFNDGSDDIAIELGADGEEQEHDQVAGVERRVPDSVDKISGEGSKEGGTAARREKAEKDVVFEPDAS